MATLVSEDPKTRCEQALKECIDCPQQATSELGGNVFRSQEKVEEGEDGGEKGDIAGHIRQTARPGTLQAMSRDGVTDLLDGEVWQMELISVCIDHTQVLVLCSQCRIQSIHEVYLGRHVDLVAVLIHRI